MDLLWETCEAASRDRGVLVGKSQPGDRFAAHDGGMDENNDRHDGAFENADVAPEHPTETTPVASEPVAGPAPTGPRLRDRMWSFRSILAVGIASLLLGGAGGAAIGAATGGHDHDHERFGRFAGPGGMRGGPGFERHGGGYGYGYGNGPGMMPGNGANPPASPGPVPAPPNS